MVALAGSLAHCVNGKDGRRTNNDSCRRNGEQGGEPVTVVSTSGRAAAINGAVVSENNISRVHDPVL